MAMNTLDRLENIYRKGAKENPEGKVSVHRMDDLTLHVTVEKKGTFKIYADETVQMLYLNSPISGSYNYLYDVDSEWWQSPT